MQDLRQKLLSPRSVALVGASDDAGKTAARPLRFLRQAGFSGTVYPINPKGGEIEGLATYKSLAEIPPDVKLDRISVYLPPAIGLKTLPDIVARGADELWLNPGSESDELVEAAQKQGLNVIQACSIVAVGMSPHDLP